MMNAFLLISGALISQAPVNTDSIWHHHSVRRVDRALI